MQALLRLNKQRRRIALAVVASCAALAAGFSLTSGSAGAAPAKLAPILIGNTCDCSGVNASSDGGWAASLTVWQKWINAHGGILHHKVQIVQQDTQSTPTATLVGNKALLANPKIVAVIPGAATGAELASTIDQAKVPYVGGLGDDTLWFTDPNVFPVATTPNNLAVLLAAVGAKGATNKNAADFYCAEVASCQQSVPLFQVGVQKAGGSLVYQASISATATSYAAQCLAAQGAGAGYLWIADATAVIVRVAQGCAQQGYNPTYVVPDYDNTFLTVPQVNGMRIAFSDQPFNSKAAATFTAAVNRYDPSLKSLPSWGQFDYQAWLSGQELAKAIELAKPSGAITRATVLKGLYLFKNQTLGGQTPPITFVKGKPPSIPCGFEGSINNGKLLSSPKPVC